MVTTITEVEVREEDVDAIGDAVDLLIQARERLEPHTPSKTRLLLDMLLLDLAERLADLGDAAKH